MIYEKQPRVPKFECTEYAEKSSDYVVLIPIINEGKRIHTELQRAKDSRISEYADIVVCDGGSTDGCTQENILRELDVNTLLVKKDTGKQGAQLRMGIWWAIQRGYQGVITLTETTRTASKMFLDLSKSSRRALTSFRDHALLKAVKGSIRLGCAIYRFV